MKTTFLPLTIFAIAFTVATTVNSQTITINRLNEVMMTLQDSGGDFTGYWTMNDGLGNMSIKLGIDNDGKYIITNDGAAELLWGAHGRDGYISLNAAKKGTSGNNIIYGISLIVNAEDNSIKVGNPNNNTGGTYSTGYKIADANGAIFTHSLNSRDGSGLDINLGSSNGDLIIFDGNGTEHYFGDQASGENYGIVLRTKTNPSSGEPIFVVESSGYSQRLRIEHDGAMKTSNFLEVDGTGQSYIKGNLAVNSTSVPTGYALSVDGKILAEEINVQSVPASDYVFESDYNLRSINEIEIYINENKHLPDIPSAKEFEENGIGLGEMDNMLLRKVEELTLYVIELKKENEELKQQSKRVDQLEEIVKELILSNK